MPQGDIQDIKGRDLEHCKHNFDFKK